MGAVVNGIIFVITAKHCPPALMITAEEAMALFHSIDIVNIGLSLECAAQKLARVSVNDGKS